MIGVDFGSDSARAVLVDALTGEICRESVALYPRWKEGLFCDRINSQYRQHPLDYLEVLTTTVSEVALGAEKSCIKGIALDTTGSTPCPVNREGTPLALLGEFSDNPNAMFWLWKDHTSICEARQLTEALKDAPSEDYTVYQGEYSAEWFWAKVLRGMRVDRDVREYGYTWVEHVDWLGGCLAGISHPEQLIRCSCGAGHKAYWDNRYGGLPKLSCFSCLDESLGKIAGRYCKCPKPAGNKIGKLTAKWADRLGLDKDTVVGTGSFDAHAGAVGAGIRLGCMVKVAGTSTVDLLVVKQESLAGIDMRNYCNQAIDSIIPGLVGIETGQAAFGDLFSWLKRLAMWPAEHMDIDSQTLKQMEDMFFLSMETAAREREGTPEPVCIDWFNGRRYPNINETVKGAFLGLSLGIDCVDLYRGLARAALFGSRNILDAFAENGLKPEEIIVVGGIADKSCYIMQQMANILEIPVRTVRTGQICALGAAIYGAVAAGIYPSIADAQRIISPKVEKEYWPDRKTFEDNRSLYRDYLRAGTCVELWTRPRER